MLGNKKVNLFIVGSAKSGTTTLFHHLSLHPRICISEEKEPNFFSYESLKNDNLYYQEPVTDTLEKYQSLFNPRPDQDIIAEASVSYLFYPGTATRIFEYNPASKIIILLRDPAERAFSHYLMDKKLGLVNLPFNEIIRMEGNERKKSLFFQQYIHYGLYFKQVATYLETFSSNQVHIIFFESLQTNFSEVLKKASAFIGLQDFLLPMPREVFNESSSPSNKWIGYIYKNRFTRKLLKKIIPSKIATQLERHFFVKSIERLTMEQRQWLRNYYHDDLKSLELLLNKNLSSWYE